MSEANLAILYTLERTVVHFWRQYPDATDHVVKRVYEMAAKVYRAETTGHEIQMPEPRGELDAELFDSLIQACQQIRAVGADALEDDPATGPVLAETLLQCLRKLLKSVDRHTKVGGNRGYLAFLSEYVR